jgi:hypothetical protein
MATAPARYFGIAERLSVFAAVGFNAVLGVELMRGALDEARSEDVRTSS